MQQVPIDRGRGTGTFVVAGLLILFGVAALAGNLGIFRISGDVVPLVVGLAFLVAYATTRRYGFLVPGAIVTGVGTGIMATSLLGGNDNGQWIVLGGGVGFLAIFLIDFLVTKGVRSWWAVIPGGIMIVVAGPIGNSSTAWQTVGVWSPLLLIVAGVALLFGRRRRQPH